VPHQSEGGGDLGLFVSLQFLGSTSGPLLGGLFGQAFGLGTPFLAYAVFAAASFIIVLRWVERSPIEGSESRKIDHRMITRAFRNYSLASINIGLLAVSVMRIGLISTILPVFASRNLELSPTAFGGVLTLFSLANFITLLPVGTLTDRLGRRPFMFTSLLFTGLLAVLIPFTGNAMGFTAIMVAMGCTLGLTGAIGAWVTDVSPPSELGASMGMFRTMGDLGSFIGPIALTFFLPEGEIVIGPAPFLLAGAIMIAASFPLLKAGDPARELALRKRSKGR